jgi:hypothetical protein
MNSIVLQDLILKELDFSFDQSIADIESCVHKNPWSKNAILLHLENPIAVSKACSLSLVSSVIYWASILIVSFMF